MHPSLPAGNRPATCIMAGVLQNAALQSASSRKPGSPEPGSTRPQSPLSPSRPPGPVEFLLSEVEEVEAAPLPQLKGCVMANLAPRVPTPARESVYRDRQT